MVRRSPGLLSRTGHRGLLSGALCAALAACSPEPPADPPLRPVRYAAVVAAAGDETRVYSGTTQAESAIDLSFRVGGTLAARFVDIGDSVGSGQPIGELETADFDARLREADAIRSAAQSAAINAEANFARVSQLYENGSSSARDFEAARSAAESARAQRDAAAEQYQAAQLQLGYTRLNAPARAECAVAQVFAEANQNVSSGQPIVRLNCGQCAEVRVNVPEVDIGRIDAERMVTISINALGLGNLAGGIREIAVDAGQGSATFPVIVAIEDQCERIRAGMAAEVAFSLQREGPAGALIVPFVSVGEARGGASNFVYVLEPADGGDYVARRRTVTVGVPTTTGLIVEQGLMAGELVATAGVGRLSDGMRVTLLDRGDLDSTP